MKTWKVVVVGALSLLMLDMVMHVETDPKWVLYVHSAAWYLFGCAMGEAAYENKLIKTIKRNVGLN